MVSSMLGRYVYSSSVAFGGGVYSFSRSAVHLKPCFMEVADSHRLGSTSILIRRLFSPKDVTSCAQSKLWAS